MEEAEIKEAEKDRSIGKHVMRGMLILSLTAAFVLFFMTYGWAFLLMGASAREARPTEKKIRAAVRKELHSRDFALEKEPADYGFRETYKVTVPAKNGKEALAYHAVYAIYDTIWNTGAVETDYYDTILKKCYDDYAGKKERIVLTETEESGLNRVRLSCTYEDLEEMEACIREAEGFCAYADGMYKKGFRFSWSFKRRCLIEGEDGAARECLRVVWSFRNTDQVDKAVTMTQFQEKLSEKLRTCDERLLYQLSPEREVYYEDGQLIEWETLPGIKKLQKKTEKGYEDAGFDNIAAFFGALPVKNLYFLMGELGLPAEGDASDFTVTAAEEDGTHVYRFSYGFYDDEGFYYLKDGEKQRNDGWNFSLGRETVSEITGIPLFY